MAPVDGVESISWKRFRLGEICACFIVMQLDLVFLRCNDMSSSVFWYVYGFGRALGSLSANVQVCAPVLLKDWCETSSTGAC